MTLLSLLHSLLNILKELSTVSYLHSLVSAPHGSCRGRQWPPCCSIRSSFAAFLSLDPLTSFTPCTPLGPELVPSLRAGIASSAVCTLWPRLLPARPGVQLGSPSWGSCVLLRGGFTSSGFNHCLQVGAPDGLRHRPQLPRPTCVSSDFLNISSPVTD